MIEVGQQPNAIRLTELDGQRYFLSLMEEGVRTGQLKPADRESLLTGCRSVLIRKTGTPPHGRADLQSDTAHRMQMHQNARMWMKSPAFFEARKRSLPKAFVRRIPRSPALKLPDADCLHR